MAAFGCTSANDRNILNVIRHFMVVMITRKALISFAHCANQWQSDNKKRMHSSRMHTVRCSGRRGGVSAPVHAGICLSRGCLPQCNHPSSIQWFWNSEIHCSNLYNKIVTTSNKKISRWRIISVAQYHFASHVHDKQSYTILISQQTTSANQTLFIKFHCN